MAERARIVSRVAKRGLSRPRGAWVGSSTGAAAVGTVAATVVGRVVGNAVAVGEGSLEWALTLRTTIVVGEATVAARIVLASALPIAAREEAGATDARACASTAT